MCRNFPFSTTWSLEKNMLISFCLQTIFLAIWDLVYVCCSTCYDSLYDNYIISGDQCSVFPRWWMATIFSDNLYSWAYHFTALQQWLPLFTVKTQRNSVIKAAWKCSAPVSLQFCFQLVVIQRSCEPFYLFFKKHLQRRLRLKRYFGKRGCDFCYYGGTIESCKLIKWMLTIYFWGNLPRACAESYGYCRSRAQVHVVVPVCIHQHTDRLQ